MSSQPLRLERFTVQWMMGSMTKVWTFFVMTTSVLVVFSNMEREMEKKSGFKDAVVSSSL